MRSDKGRLQHRLVHQFKKVASASCPLDILDCYIRHDFYIAI
ncbi:hypothetical protein [Microcoleus sp. FACHB-68]|nr:hypothetical protein [Microcoleus sp. FACHB-68]